MEVQPSWMLKRWISGTRKGISEEVVSQRMGFMLRVSCLAVTTLSPNMTIAWVGRELRVLEAAVVHFYGFWQAPRD